MRLNALPSKIDTETDRLSSEPESTVNVQESLVRGIMLMCTHGSARLGAQKIQAAMAYAEGCKHRVIVSVKLVVAERLAA